MSTTGTSTSTGTASLPTPVPTSDVPGAGFTISADGTAIGWQRTGEGPPVVFLHGTSSERSGWALSTRHMDHRVSALAVDRRGRGLSGDGPRYAFEREVDDVAAVVATLDERPHVVGHSYGAVLALAAASRGVPVRSLTLYEPVLAVADQLDVDAVAAACDGAIAAGDPDACLEAFYTAIGEGERLAAMRHVPRVYERFLRDAHTIARELRASLGFSIDLAEGIDVPVHLLVGSASPALFQTTTARLAEAIPQAEVTVIEGQAHLAQAFAPDVFATVVLDFLDRS